MKHESRSQPENLITTHDELPEPPVRHRRRPKRSHERILVRSQEVTRQALLTEAATFLARSLGDPHGYLQRIADLVARSFADWCVVLAPQRGGTFRIVAEAPVDGARGALASSLRRRTARWSAMRMVAMTARAGRGQLLANVSEALVERRTIDLEELRLYTTLGVRSALAVPVMTDRGAELVLCVFSLRTNLRFDEDDLESIEKLACSVTTALEHSRRFSHPDELLRARSNLVADAVSHEVRTPLSALLLQLENLRVKIGGSATAAPDSSTVQDGIDRALVQARRLRDIVEDLLLRPPL